MVATLGMVEPRCLDMRSDRLTKIVCRALCLYKVVLEALALSLCMPTIASVSKGQALPSSATVTLFDKPIDVDTKHRARDCSTLAHTAIGTLPTAGYQPCDGMRRHAIP